MMPNEGKTYVVPMVPPALEEKELERRARRLGLRIPPPEERAGNHAMQRLQIHVLEGEARRREERASWLPWAQLAAAFVLSLVALLVPEVRRAGLDAIRAVAGMFGR